MVDEIGRITQLLPTDKLYAEFELAGQKMYKSIFISDLMSVRGDVAVNGGDLTTTATTFNLFTSNVLTANLFTTATTISFGAPTGTLTLNNPSVRFADGSAAAPSITFASDPNTGLMTQGAIDYVQIVGGGVIIAAVHNDGGGLQGIRMPAASQLSWASGTQVNVVSDTILARDAANTLALRNGVNAQTANIYNTYTSASVYERLSIGWASNVCTIKTEHTGATLRGLKIGGTTTDLIGFYGVTPTAQGASVADATDAATAITQLNALISRIEATGLIATV